MIEQRVEVIFVPVGGATYEHRARVAETRYAQPVLHAGDGRSVLRLLSDDGITAELTRAKWRGGIKGRLLISPSKTGGRRARVDDALRGAVLVRVVAFG